jgi:hypothetical protein
MSDILKYFTVGSRRPQKLMVASLYQIQQGHCLRKCPLKLFDKPTKKSLQHLKRKAKNADLTEQNLFQQRRKQR